MSAILEAHIESNKINAFQNRCDLFSKQCAVLLGFFVPVSTFATQVVLFLLLASWFLAGSLKEKGQFIVNHPVARITFLFFGVFVIGTLYSQASWVDSLWMLEKIGKLLYLPFLLPIMQEKKWRRAGMLAFLSAMLLTLILSLLKIYAGLPIVINPRFSGAAIFKDTIFTNLMMAFASFMVGHLFLNQTHFLKRIGLGILLATLVFYILFMGTGRSGYVVFSVLWLLFALQRSSLKGVAIGFLSLAILLSFAYFNSPVFQTRCLDVLADFDQHTAGNSDNSIGQRLEFLNHTWQLSKERLWFGHGTGSFKEIYQNYSAMNHLTRTQNPHNEYINTLFQLGLFGVTVFVGFFVVLFKWSFALPRSEKWFAQGIILAIATGCLANSWLMDFTSGYFFVMILVFCFGALNLKKDFQCE
ncbi:MAG TPA: O-antigen ligase family protein [Gammaproteobacteria bacterium]|nr:O-antigen ligase family protein [Gammaproteobacteria bacterium]HQZ87335.1 O-antigen ligase family protein [Gammaproteobacteria bacterium]HRA42463.1 O-antigen ligase family protein [Gammaproteobacteria bacterium]